MGKGNIIRVRETGVTSYYPRTMDKAREIITIILERNGCGLTEVKRDAKWTIVNRFEPFYGIVSEA